MQRRPLLLGALAAPFAVHDASAQAARTLRVIPQANLTSLDPIWTTAVVTRNHGFLVYDTLTAEDAQGRRIAIREGWIGGIVRQDGDAAGDGVHREAPGGRR